MRKREHEAWGPDRSERRGSFPYPDSLAKGEQREKRGEEPTGSQAKLPPVFASF